MCRYRIEPKKPDSTRKRLIFADLFEMSLSETLRVLLIPRVWSVQDQLAIQAYALTLYDRTVPVRMIAEMQLVRPPGAAVARPHVNGDSDARELPGMQRTHLTHTTAHRYRFVESRPGNVTQETERIQNVGLARGVRADEEGATA